MRPLFVRPDQNVTAFQKSSAFGAGIDTSQVIKQPALLPGLVLP